MKNRIIVVGGGAAGMMAAIVAANEGAEVKILERNDRVGKKLLATGNGRCNYTNINLSINNYHGKDNLFAEWALNNFDVKTTIDYFEKLGITPAIEDNGKVYPLSFQSSSMLDILRYEIEEKNIELITEAYVVDIKRRKNFILKLKDGKTLEADKLILAAGGMAMPVSGSDGNGYSLAKSLGHSLIPIHPGIVQLNLEGIFFKQIDGVKVVGVAKLYSKDKLLLEDNGDILFTKYGISGPPVLQLSRTALEYLKDGKDIELRVSIIHTKTSKELESYLYERFKNNSNKTAQESLVGLINKRLILPILREINIDKDKLVRDLSKAEVEKISQILTSWNFKITGSQGWGQAQVTAGGISTLEIDHRTMESKLVKGLYLVGELLDIDGDCGGYNLQWAWSSGYIAGKEAAK